MKHRTALLAAAVLAAPFVLAAQAPPGPVNPPPGPGAGPQGPGWGQQMGPQMQGPGRVGQGQAMGMGMRGRMGMAMRERMAARNLTLGQLARNPQFRERIGLTPEQVSKIQAQESIFAKARIRNQAELQVKRMELRELMQEEKPDRALIEKKMREVTEAEFAQRKAAVDHQLTMRDLITPEQKQKLQEVRQEMRTRHMQAGQGRGMGPGMGLGRGPQGPQPPQPPAPPKPPDDKPNF